jgi:hypothetical protein
MWGKGGEEEEEEEEDCEPSTNTVSSDDYPPLQSEWKTVLNKKRSRRRCSP